ncbi:MAG: PAS domain S-box protein, partial [Verrucomicrobiota bacterium]|nr:PAS domain S-box protein [Verrucomicrobiota bacterium]
MKTKIKKRPVRHQQAQKTRRSTAGPLPSDALLAAALRGLGEGVFIAEPKSQRNGLRMLFVNDHLSAMMGYSLSELVNRGHAFLHADEASIVRQRRWLKKLAPGCPFSGEGYLVGKSGANIYASWNFTPLFDARGRPTHVVAAYRDITAKRRLQETLVHSQRLDAVGRLAGGVAHDFNNLLSVINGYCEILAARLPAADPARREIHEIHQAGQKAAILVRQLLAFSRRQKLNPQVINLNSIVRDHAEILG